MIKLGQPFAVKVKKLFYLVAYCIFMEPKYFYYVPKIDKFFRFAMYVLLFVLLFKYIFVWKHKTRSKIAILVIFYHIYLISVTIFRHGAVNDIVTDSIIFVGLTILTELVIHDDSTFLVKELLNLLIIELFINAFTIIIFPNGLYVTEYFKYNFFLGYDNQHINIMLPALILALIKYKYKLKNSKFSLAVTIFLNLFIALSRFSGATLVVIFLTFILSLPIVTNRTWIFNGKNYFLTNIVMFFSICIMKLYNGFRYIIENILGKSMTFTGRIYIWDRALYYIKQNWLFGYGVETYTYRDQKMNLPWYYPAELHAHNRFIETMYRGGLVLTVIYLIILIIAFKGTMKSKNIIAAKMIAIGIFVYLTGMLTEFYKHSYLFFPMLLMGELVSEIDVGLMNLKQRKINSNVFLKEEQSI